MQWIKTSSRLQAEKDAVVAALPPNRRCEALLSAAKAEAMDETLPALLGAWREAPELESMEDGSVRSWFDDGDMGPVARRRFAADSARLLASTLKADLAAAAPGYHVGTMCNSQLEEITSDAATRRWKLWEVLPWARPCGPVACVVNSSSVAIKTVLGLGRPVSAMGHDVVTQGERSSA
eukprot:Skav229177  [mRNA]  locus=scaffold1004:159837:165653:+ [translate_table: standard]